VFGLLLGLILAVFIPAAASAEVRTVNATDPADATPTISGKPNNPDIASVSASYDTAGSLTITVSYYHAFTELDTSEHFAFWGEFAVTEGTEPYGDPSHCFGGGSGAGLYGQNHVYSNGGVTFYNQGEISGYSGKLPFTRSEGFDHRSVTVSASSPALANHNWTCLSYDLHARTYSSASNIHSEYGEGCGCWYVNSQLDSLGGEALNDGVWFNGFQPPPKPVIIKKKKTRFHGYAASTRCQTAALTSWIIQPSYTNGAEQPFTGTIVASIAGRTKRFVAEEEEAPVTWRHVHGGYYSIKLRYLGDQYREPSEWITVPVRVRSCHRPHRHHHHRHRH
jgi:hypothetical protein